MNNLVTPNFLCIGAQKAGTTSLHDILRQHPEIYLPERKEAHFFDNEERYAKGLNWWMNEFFSSYSSEPLIGVMTPEYLYYKEVPERIAKDLTKDVKLIVILRHPVDRAYSHYLMSKQRGFEKLSFEDAIEAEAERITKGDFERNHFSYIDRGRYASQLQRYLDLFPRENILFLSFEQNIKRELDQTLRKIQEFIGVEPMNLDTGIKSNVASETKSKTLQHMVRGDNWAKRLLKPLIPQKTRRAMKQKVNQMNSQELGAQAKLEDTTRALYFERFFQHETASVSQLASIDFSYWEQKNSST